MIYILVAGVLPFSQRKHRDANHDMLSNIFYLPTSGDIHPANYITTVLHQSKIFLGGYELTCRAVYIISDKMEEQSAWLLNNLSATLNGSR